MWMTPFALAIRDEGFEQLKIHKSPAEDESDSQSTNIQTHTVDLKLLVRLQLPFLLFHSFVATVFSLYSIRP